LDLRDLVGDLGWRIARSQYAPDSFWLVADSALKVRVISACKRWGLGLYWTQFDGFIWPHRLRSIHESQ